MKKIAFICSTSGRDSAGLLEQFKYLTPNHSGIWKDIQGVSNIEEAEYYIVFEEFKQEFADNYDLSKVIYFQAEPGPIRTNRVSQKYIDKFFTYFDYDNYHFPPFWSSRIYFNDLVRAGYPNKTSNLSCIMSTKIHKKLNGYQQRQNFLLSFVSSYPDSGIDVFGRGRIDKELNYNDTCPKEGYAPYVYTISCENCSIPGHATDRLYDSILNWCIPIYWGMSNIEKLGLPIKSYRTFDIEDSVDKVKDTLMPITLKDIGMLKEARNIIMYKLNFWEKIHETLKGI